MSEGNMIQHENKSKPGNPNWKPGQSGNVKGRPIGSRQKIAEKLLADITEVWQACGTEVLKRLATEEPAKLATIAYGLIPKDVFLNVAHATPGDMDSDDWATLHRLVKLIRASTPDGAPPAVVFETIERALRGEFSAPLLIEHQPASIPPPPY